MPRALLAAFAVRGLALAASAGDDPRTILRARRQHHLDVLRAYRDAGVFPLNTSLAGDGHFLIDARGTLCAVANLIAQDGLRPLVVQAAGENNALLFAEVQDGPFHDWILTSGFTREEIARIQAPAPPVADFPEVTPSPRLVAAANRRVTAYLAAVERALRDETDAGLDLAIRRLAARQDLRRALAMAR